MAESTTKTIDLHKVFLHLQQQMITALSTDREVIQHPTTKGTATELHWLKMLGDYLPKRYCADNAFVLDCEGHLSEQVDVVIYDRQYSPFLFNQDGAKYVPAESVYAVLEVKPELDGANVAYAAGKAASVRRLRRTSTSIPHAGGKFDPKAPPAILAGILTLDSEWNPAFGKPFAESIAKLSDVEHLDVGCVLRAGGFDIGYGQAAPKINVGSPATALIFFFLKLLARLQAAGTVAALDLDEYGKSL
ncbi:MAG: DUF6602 domain-containing protein [Halobacteriota archaeon]|jgi:hypothetical protein